MARIIAAGHVAKAAHSDEKTGCQANTPSVRARDWSPSLKRKVRSTAAGNLKKFLAQR